MEQFTITEPYLDLHLSLGEGPHWDPVSRILRFVDIHAQTIHTVAPDVGPSSHTVVATLDTCVSHTAALAGVPDKYAFGGRAGIGIFDASTKTYKYVARWWAGEEEGEQGRREREMRGNDGGIDSRGRYFVGVMNEPRVVGLGPVGAVFRYEGNKLDKVIEGVTIPNGLTWSRDEKTLYFADSGTRNIYAYQYDIETGAVGERRLFYRVPEEAGEPDGQAIDDEGYMWTAIYGIGKVIRISPDGERVAEISLPTRCVTCPVFVDDWLYIITAEEADPETHPDSAKYGGGLFRCQVGRKGMPIHELKW